MPAARYHIAESAEPTDAADLAEIFAGFDAIRGELHVSPAFPDAVEAEAVAAAERGPVPPPGSHDDADSATVWVDRRDIEFVAIDPPGSRDLDQAFWAERDGDGYRVWYAIADVAAFVHPGSAVEAESLERGVTLYAPDRRTPVHPVAISEDAASLLPGLDRPACLWRLDLDPDGRLIDAHVGRATVRVREAISYRDAQTEIDGDATRPSLALLAEIGRLRLALEVERGAVSLALPAQEIERDDAGRPRLVYDVTVPVESWNAQVSLMTGMAAADLMLGAGVGLLRTLPPADDATLAELRLTAAALGVDWPTDETYADRVRRLDPTDPREVALLMRSARGLRGAGYVAFTDHDEVPDQREHSAIAAAYAHVTAPLRRVCDRYATEVVLAICAGRTPPTWAVERLPELPSVMGRARDRERALERAVVDHMETIELEPHVGDVFDAVVVNHRRSRNGVSATIQLTDPAVIAELATGDEADAPALGARVRVRLDAVDRSRRRLTFTPVP